MWQLLCQRIGTVPRTLLWDNESGIVQRGRLARQRLPRKVVSAGRTFVSVADFNAQLLDWLTSVANRRTHATTRLTPAGLLVADQVAMAGLPPLAPAVGATTTTRLGRDSYVSFGGNAYSVHPEVIGRMITVTADLDRIIAHWGDLVVADHERLWGTAVLVSDPQHLAAAAVLRERFRTRPSAGAHLQVEVEVADLSAYGAVFGTGEVA